MDASLVNGLNVGVAGSLPRRPVGEARGSASVSGTSVAVSRGQVPVMDTVEITSAKPAPASASPSAVFDPTAVDGPFEQKHIGGVLATSSAIDGYNGWETMLKHLFGIQNGGDKSDIPVIPSFNWGGHGPYSVEGGYTPGHRFTQEERNLIANMYVYAHDHGMSELAVSHYTSAAYSPDRPYKVHDFECTWYGPKNPADWIDHRVLKGRAAMVEYFRRGVMDPPWWFNQPEEAAQTVVETLSSAALNDNLIPKNWIVNAAGEDCWGYNGSNTIKDYKDMQALVYAYSPHHSDGKPSELGVQSAEVQRYIAWREANFSQVRSMIAEAKQPAAAPVPGTQGAAGAGGVGDSGSYFDKYSARIEGLVAALDDSQKATLGELYNLAGKKGGEQALQKVDALAKAMVTANFMEVMFLPGRDKDGKKTTNLLDMLVWTKDLPDQAKVLQTVIAKKTQDNQPITPTPEKTATLKPTGKTQTTPGVTETPTKTTETKETAPR
ncbi:hypothetical protein [Mobiluncus mulieris]|uniref:Uncharacterized protein n=1 Tax=Mobiluncus mulieris TaxID=2052 RepID=A0A7Y0USZ1_9ACTO|nr:hypothetical protein [Mobiluncus mulieris]NMX03171.1 hypothetical protein [Mobiluncus mulieris]